MKSFLIYCLLAALLLSQVAFAQADDSPDQQLKQLESKLEENQLKRAENLKEIAAYQSDIAQVLEQKLMLDYIIYQTEIDILEQEVDLQLVRRELAQAKADLQQHFEDFGERLRVIYLRSEGDAKLKALLTSQNFSEFLGRMMYIDAIVDEDQRIVLLLKEKQAEIKQLEAAEEAKLDELAGLMELLADDRRRPGSLDHTDQ